MVLLLILKPFLFQVFENLFNNLNESPSKTNFVLTLFFILVPMSLLCIWNLYVHLTQQDIVPVFKRMPKLWRGFIYIIIFLSPFGPVVSYIENSYAQIKYMNITSEISGKVFILDIYSNITRYLKIYFLSPLNMYLYNFLLLVLLKFFNISNYVFNKNALS